MKKVLPIILFIAILLNNCEKSSYLIDDDPFYPTIIGKIDPYDLTEMRTEFSEKNIYLFSSLNEFGFCAPPEDYFTPMTPPGDTVSSQAEAIAIAKRFIAKNPQFTGVRDTADLRFTYFKRTTGHSDGSARWHLYSALQKKDTLDVLSTQIIITIRCREVYSCTGNWYPEVYVPGRINVTAGEARDILLDMKATHFNIAGNPYNVTITRESLSWSTAKLMVVPIQTGETTELRLAWQVNIPSPVFYLMYVDAMTGQIIKQEPTIIS
jgi:hypothetical protein